MDAAYAGGSTAKLFLELASVGLELDKIATAFYLRQASPHQQQLQESLAASKGKLDAVGAALMNRCVEGTAQHERWNKIIHDMNAKFRATCNLQRQGEALAIAAAATTSAGPTRLPSAVPQVATSMAGTPTSSQVAVGAYTVVPAAGGAEGPKLASGNTGAVPASLLNRAGAEWGGAKAPQQPDSAPPRISSHEGTRRGQGADALLRLSGSVDIAQQNHESNDQAEGVNPIVAAYDHVAAIAEHSARTRPIDAEVLGPRKQLLKTANTTWSRFLAQAQTPVPRSGDGAGAGRGTLVQFSSPGLRSVGSPGRVSDASPKPVVTSAPAPSKPSTSAPIHPGTAAVLVSPAETNGGHPGGSLKRPASGTPGALLSEGVGEGGGDNHREVCKQVGPSPRAKAKWEATATPRSLEKRDPPSSQTMSQLVGVLVNAQEGVEGAGPPLGREKIPLPALN